MNGAAIPPAPAIGTSTSGGIVGVGGVGGVSSPSAAEVNSFRIGVVAERLAMCANSGQNNDGQQFFHLCLSLARGIDYAVANNEIPPRASELPLALKQVCRRRNEYVVLAAIMTVMISVKNACKMGWFSAKDTQELLGLANEVSRNFSSAGDINYEAISFLPTVSKIMSRFYPRLKLGNILASVEVEPGYAAYVVDFHISKKVTYSPQEKIRLFVSQIDDIDTSSCIINPQQLNILLNGKPVERRTNVFMDTGPQLPTSVNSLLKFGTNLLQAVGQCNGHYIILVAFMSEIPSSELPAPENYVQHDNGALNSALDSEIVEGPSRISLNCPISYKRIKKPVKGQLCKHHQCFDFDNYVQINSRRPSWRCPHCNQSVCYPDIRIDQKMVKILQEVGEIVSEVIIAADGSWDAALSSNNHENEPNDKTQSGQPEDREIQDSSTGMAIASGNVCDLTEGDDEMIIDLCDLEDTKPQIHLNHQNQATTTSELNQNASAQANEEFWSSLLLSSSLSEPQRDGSMSSGANFGLSPVLTDAISPSLNRQADIIQGVNHSTNLTVQTPSPASISSLLQESQYMQPVASNDHNGRVCTIPRNVSRVQSAIQALPVPMASPIQNPGPSLNNSAANGTSLPSPMSPSVSRVESASRTPSDVERPLQSSQPLFRPINVPTLSPSSLAQRSTAQVVDLSAHGQASGAYRVPSGQQSQQQQQPMNLRMSQPLSQPPHLMRSSHASRPSLVHRGVPPGGPTLTNLQAQPRVSLSGTSPTTPAAQPRVQTPSGSAPSMPFMGHRAAHMARTAASLDGLRTGGVDPRRAAGGSVAQQVTRTENLIDIQSEQNWRPSGRMRGSLTGQAYNAALSQFMAQQNQPAPAPAPSPAPAPAPTPSPRPPSNPVSTAMPPHLQAFRMNRQHVLHTSQAQNSPVTPTDTGTGVSHRSQGLQ